MTSSRRLDIFRRRSTWLFPVNHPIAESPNLETGPSSTSILQDDTTTVDRKDDSLASKSVAKALKRLLHYSVAIERDTKEFPPNGDWRDHTFKITNENGFPYMFITAEVIRSCLCRRKRIDLRVMTPEGHRICVMHGKISLRRYLKIMFEPSFSSHGEIIQPTFRPFFFLETILGVKLYRIEPLNSSDMMCYGWSDLPAEYLIYTMQGFERNAKAGTHWEKFKLPNIYAKDVYKRTSLYALAFSEDSALDPYQRLLLIGLHLTLKVIRAEFFYDQKDFVTNFAHPERSKLEKYRNKFRLRPNIR